MKIEKFKVLLYLKKSGLDKNGKAPIMGRITVNRTRRSSPASCLALHRFGIPVPADWRARARKPWRPTRTSSSCCFPSKRLSMCLWKRERTYLFLPFGTTLVRQPHYAGGRCADKLEEYTAVLGNRASLDSITGTYYDVLPPDVETTLTLNADGTYLLI